MSVLPPATLEGWYALHQVFALDWAALGRLQDAERERLAGEATSLLAALAAPEDAGWSGAFQLVGGGADFMLIHFRETPEALAAAQLQVRRSALGPLLRLAYDYTSVTEAGLYQATVDAAREAEPDSEEYRRIIEELAAAEKASRHVKLRLYPEVPEGMRYVSFYPMTKRRAHPDNWYTLPVEERNRLMREHGLTGRRYAGRIFQVITGSVGLDDWEWGVTLFARDLLDIKGVVTDMRYDEASSRYGEFGRFFTGIRRSPEEWTAAFLSS
ncbi:MAG TPA: hydrogen peroxide-dependent heme synthase [Longimicrobiales bacterium]